MHKGLAGLCLAWTLAGPVLASPTADIQGLVISVDPISGNYTGLVDKAEVFLEPTHQHEVSNDLGIFAFRKLKPGTYVIVVKAAGYKDARIEVEAEVGVFPTEARVNLEPLPLTPTPTPRRKRFVGPPAP